MGISSKLAGKFALLSQTQKSKLIKMALSDKVSFQEIKKIFDFTPGEVEKFMRTELSLSGFTRWKKRRNKKFTQKSKKARLIKEL